LKCTEPKSTMKRGAQNSHANADHFPLWPPRPSDAQLDRERDDRGSVVEAVEAVEAEVVEAVEAEVVEAVMREADAWCGHRIQWIKKLLSKCAIPKAYFEYTAALSRGQFAAKRRSQGKRLGPNRTVRTPPRA
jgi:hypothetical protein